MDVRKYADGTHETTAPALKAADMVGRAVATMVESRQETRMQRARPKKTAITLRRGRRFVWSVSDTVSERRPVGSSSSTAVSASS